MSDSTEFPLIFGLRGKSFLWVFTNRKEFVDFTLTDMKKPTGLFLVWKEYCQEKGKRHAKHKSVKSIKVV
jgi:hypothetical protein